MNFFVKFELLSIFFVKVRSFIYIFSFDTSIFSINRVVPEINNLESVFEK